jgi:hypothetical protein
VSTDHSLLLAYRVAASHHLRLQRRWSSSTEAAGNRANGQRNATCHFNFISVLIASRLASASLMLTYRIVELMLA